MLELNELEVSFIKRILAAPESLSGRLEYANWLQGQGDSRGEFLQSFVNAMKTMAKEDFPNPSGFSSSWLDLVGFTLMESLASFDDSLKYRDSILKLTEAAIRIDTAEKADSEITIGISKYGGEPDLPVDVNWPLAMHCDAIYNEDTKGIEELAGFLMQIELGDCQASAIVDLPLPKSGLLSFFCYQDEDDVDCIGVNVFHYDESRDLQRLSPPGELTSENTLHKSKRLEFRETLRVKPGVRTGDRELDEIIWELRCKLIDNQTLFGVNDYQTDDIHFIGITKDCATTVFIDVSEDISQVDLSWVEFDGDSGFK